jgi:hypothetical protein
MNKIRNVSLGLCFCLLFWACGQRADKAPAGIKHVFVVGIDAMSTQGMEKASTPTMD